MEKSEERHKKSCDVFQELDEWMWEIDDIPKLNEFDRWICSTPSMDYLFSGLDDAFKEFDFSDMFKDFDEEIQKLDDKDLDEEIQKLDDKNLDFDYFDFDEEF